MVFDNCNGQAHKFQGAVGEARAIYELTKKGYVVYKPLAELTKSDLVIEDLLGKLSKVQVKTSTQQIGNSGQYVVNLVTSGGRQVNNSRRRVRSAGDYDFLFILITDGRCWLIPDEALGNNGTLVTVGTEKYSMYEIE